MPARIVRPGRGGFFPPTAAVRFLDNAIESGALKAIIIENFMGDEQREIIEELSEDSIRKRAETEDLQAIAAGLKEQLITFFSAFDSEMVKSINSLYNLLLVFLQFIHYDYYFVLRKFDSSLPEGDFFHNPKFEAIHGNYVSDDLKDWSKSRVEMTICNGEVVYWR